MISPRTKVIETTLGNVVIRAMKRREANDIFKLYKAVGKVKDDAGAIADASVKIEEAQLKCVEELPKGKSIDDLENWEVKMLLAEIVKLSNEYVEKN